MNWQGLADQRKALDAMPLSLFLNGERKFCVSSNRRQNLAMTDDEIREKIDLRSLASQNEQLFRELRGILERLDMAALSDEQIQAKLNELLHIAKGANR
jgi:hypothetical protein